LQDVPPEATEQAERSAESPSVSTPV
jgi:hypothetical protein